MKKSNLSNFYTGKSKFARTEDDYLSNFTTLTKYLNDFKYLSESNDGYNQLVGGRTGFLVAQAVLNSNLNTSFDVKIVSKVFHYLVEDIIFINEKITWLPPTHIKFNNKNVLSRNIGIYLGLSIINKFYYKDDNIIAILKSISFDFELKCIRSVYHRKLCQELLYNPDSKIQISCIYSLISYFESSTNIVILDVIICFAVVKNFLRDDKIYKFIKDNLFNCDSTFLYTIIQIIKRNDSDGRSPCKINLLNKDVVAKIFKKNFSLVYRFCGEEMICKIIQEKSLETCMNPFLWLKEVQNTFPQKSIIFRNLILREKIRLYKPDCFFLIPNLNYRNIEVENNVLIKMHNRNFNDISNLNFKIIKSKILIINSKFWIGMLNDKYVASSNLEEKMELFYKLDHSKKYTILLTKRYEKKISWQGRSFSKINEIEFINYFLNKFNNISDYKVTYIDNAIEDYKIIELLFWGLEIGIIELE